MEQKESSYWLQEQESALDFALRCVHEELLRHPFSGEGARMAALLKKANIKNALQANQNAIDSGMYDTSKE